MQKIWEFVTEHVAHKDQPFWTSMGRGSMRSEDVEKNNNLWSRRVYFTPPQPSSLSRSSAHPSNCIISFSFLFFFSLAQSKISSLMLTPLLSLRQKSQFTT